jgi:hypothetical protein
MGLPKISTVVLAVCLAGACARHQAPEAPRAPQPTVFDPLTRQLDKAHGVEAAADANAEATRKAVDAQERGDSTP